ncbi:hypothetical protein I6F35_37965 [Bradyrhizobium sp. BRP22]|uniref:hypothetical protein n=1 Tax=Bradyrhizobium sp. BRP22 TaxID=2793821 RepID=UPI001CD26DE7|nr:hypothetical protein [Bradyrhizobium sp. BRP22]MCA1458855.1 hypothetical protein [Bradyrhizobium sp. BRP22]
MIERMSTAYIENEAIEWLKLIVDIKPADEEANAPQSDTRSDVSEPPQSDPSPG